MATDDLSALRRRAEEVEVLNEIARISTSGAELRPMLQQVVEAMRRRFSWEFVACVSVDLANDRFVCEAVTGEEGTGVHVGYSRALGSGVVGRVAATAEPILLDDVRLCDFYVETFPGALSELCLPVRHQGDVVAILNLESRRLAAFHDQVRLLETVAEQVAGAIHLARMNERLVEANRMLRDANRRLEEAQEKIARLMESTPGALDDIEGWARSLAEEIAAAIGAQEIGVWLTEDGAVRPLVAGGTRAPSAAHLRTLSSGENAIGVGGDLVVGIEGMSGEHYGALVVTAFKGGRWFALLDSERRLLSGFARQLGGALELRRMRRQLAAADEIRAASRQRMHEQGIATVVVCPSCGRCFDHLRDRCPVDGFRLDATHILPLRVLGRYRLSHRLGQGGMGTVFSAVDEKLGREVAIKVIRPEHLRNPDMKVRIQHEASSLARISHASVVALHDSGEFDDGSVFLVMERLRGRDLGHVMEEHGRGTPQQVARLLREAGAGLSAAHRAGVVHRDVKPQNLFLMPADGQFHVKLFDFGLAKSVLAERGVTQIGTMVGTPAYMSPEQVRGEPLDARSDVYSLATVVYEALTGRPVVPGRELGRILTAVLDAEAPPPSTLLPGLHPAVDLAFAAALAKRRDDRPADVESWVSGLAFALDEAPPSGGGWPATAFAVSDESAVPHTGRTLTLPVP